MISLDDLKKIAKLKGLKSAGNAEKDYLIDIALLSASRNTKDELVFKGGTCLHKFYGLNRFSEDLDFTLKKELDIDAMVEKIIADFSLFGIEAEIKNKKKAFNSIMTTIRTKGPLYQGSSNSLSSIRIDINLKSSIAVEPLLANYGSLYPDIPSFSLFVMQEKEILAEKVRTIMSRTKARDVYDLWFLLSKGTAFDKDLVKEKLKYYNEEWNAKKFEKMLKLKKAVWESELKPVVASIPSFEEAKKIVLEKIRKG